MCFLGIKSYEYHDKWIHYELKLNDGTFADGHLVDKSPDFDLAKKRPARFTIHGRIVTDETPALRFALAKGHPVEGDHHQGFRYHADGKLWSLA